MHGISALLTPQGWALLESLPTYDPEQAFALTAQLRTQGHPAEVISAALTQSRLRKAAAGKFGPFATGMLFTPAGLEQATRLAVAARHAQRFVSAGVTSVADLGCGIGADSMALAGLDREVLAVERDEVTAAVATVNLRHWEQARVLCQDATTTDLTGIQGVFLDPARRTGTGARRLDPREASPPLSFVEDLARRIPAVGMKTAPGIPHDLVPAGAEAQWISVDSDVVEAGLWFGSLAREGIRHSALVIRGDEAHELHDGHLAPAETGPVGAYLYEPDGAVIRAGLVTAVTGLIQGRLIDPTIAYLTADRLTKTPYASAYAVEDVFGFSLKALRTWLHDRGIGNVTIKKRGTAVDIEVLRKQLRLRGTGQATVVLTRIAGRQSILIVRPIR